MVVEELRCLLTGRGPLKREGDKIFRDREESGWLTGRGNEPSGGGRGKIKDASATTK